MLHNRYDALSIAGDDYDQILLLRDELLNDRDLRLERVGAVLHVQVYAKLRGGVLLTLYEVHIERVAGVPHHRANVEILCESGGGESESCDGQSDLDDMTNDPSKAFHFRLLRF